MAGMIRRTSADCCGLWAKTIDRGLGGFHCCRVRKERGPATKYVPLALLISLCGYECVTIAAQVLQRYSPSHSAWYCMSPCALLLLVVLSQPTRQKCTVPRLSVYIKTKKRGVG